VPRELLERVGGFVRRADDLRGRNGNAGVGEDLAGLVFVDLHDGRSLMPSVAHANATQRNASHERNAMRRDATVARRAWHGKRNAYHPHDMGWFKSLFGRTEDARDTPAAGEVYLGLRKLALSITADKMASVPTAENPDPPLGV
jgi:hypothetical protein